METEAEITTLAELEGDLTRVRETLEADVATATTSIENAISDANIGARRAKSLVASINLHLRSLDWESDAQNQVHALFQNLNQHERENFTQTTTQYDQLQSTAASLIDT